MSERPTRFSADFETTTDPADCRVWAWAICSIDDSLHVEDGNTLESFIEYVKEQGGIYYFHNLKFDGEFIVSYLLQQGFEHNPDRYMRSKTFQTIISDNGQWYELKVCFFRKGKKKAQTATFRDSLKKLPMTVERIAKSFNLPMRKLEMDYDDHRPVGHELTPEERAYLHNDVLIVAMALREQFDQGLERLTIGSDALHGYRDIYPHFASVYPVLDIDDDAFIRRAYRGGWTYANPRFQADADHPNRLQGVGLVFDVNSLYPSVMYDRRLPVGIPLWFDGQYERSELFPLYIQFLTCEVRLKPNHLPTLQIKNNPFYMANEYIADSEGYVELALTNVDLDILFEHYDVNVLSYDGGYMFRSGKGMFCEYIDHWMEVKMTSTGGKRELAKLMLNSLYGKFATNPDVTQKVPYLDDDKVVHYMRGREEKRDPVYTAMGCFITAYAREVTIRAAQANYDRFCYADTDSIHLIGEDMPDLDIDQYRLGAWKLEARFDKAKYVRAKTYMEHVTHVGEEVDGHVILSPTDPFDDVKCAGMPENVKRHVTFDNFRRGLVLDGKLRPRHVPNGIVLEETSFTLM